MEKEHKKIDPYNLIGDNDSFVPSVEELVNASKIAVEIERGKRTHSVPNEFVLRIRPISGHAKRLKVLARKGGDRITISLVTEQGDVLRQYNYHYGGHGNPDHTAVGDSHKHFPTNTYPLRENHKGVDTWAYDPGPFPDDFVEAVKHFCNECNITVEGLQERLAWGWFR